jgi:hypothetical protein
VRTQPVANKNTLQPNKQTMIINEAKPKAVFLRVIPFLLPIKQQAAK